MSSEIIPNSIISFISAQLTQILGVLITTGKPAKWRPELDGENGNANTGSRNRVVSRLSECFPVLKWRSRPLAKPLYYEDNRWWWRQSGDREPDLLHCYKSEFNLIIPRVNDLGARLFYLHTNTSFSSLKYDKRGYFARCDFLPHPVGAENNRSKTIFQTFFSFITVQYSTFISFSGIQTFRLQNNSYGRVSASYRSRNLYAKDKNNTATLLKCSIWLMKRKNLVHLQVPF